MCMYYIVCGICCLDTQHTAYTKWWGNGLKVACITCPYINTHTQHLYGAHEKCAANSLALAVFFVSSLRHSACMIYQKISAFSLLGHFVCRISLAQARRALLATLVRDECFAKLVMGFFVCVCLRARVLCWVHSKYCPAMVWF